MPILQQVPPYLPLTTVGSMERSQWEWQLVLGVIQTFMVAIVRGTVHQETTAQGTTPVMAMETLCAGLDGQTQLQTVLHVRTIPDTFSASFFGVIFNLIHQKPAHSRFIYVVAVVEFAEINVSSEWR